MPYAGASIPPRLLGVDRGYCMRPGVVSIAAIVIIPVLSKLAPSGCRLLCCCGARPPNRAGGRARALRPGLMPLPYRRRGARARFGALGPLAPLARPSAGGASYVPSVAAPMHCRLPAQTSGAALSRLEDGGPLAMMRARASVRGRSLALRGRRADAAMGAAPSGSGPIYPVGRPPCASRFPPARGDRCQQRGSRRTIARNNMAIWR